MKFGYQNELRAYNTRVRRDRIDAIIAKACGIGLVIYILVEMLA